MDVMGIPGDVMRRALSWPLDEIYPLKSRGNENLRSSGGGHLLPGCIGLDNDSSNMKSGKHHLVLLVLGVNGYW